MTALLADEETTGLMTALLQINRSLHKPVVISIQICSSSNVCVISFLLSALCTYIRVKPCIGIGVGGGADERRRGKTVAEAGLSRNSIRMCSK